MHYRTKPFPAVRVNSKAGRFTKNAKEYHNKMNILRILINQGEYTKTQIIEALIKGNYVLDFCFELPKSWTNKKKACMLHKPHQNTPDIDNLFKAFTDTVFYGEKEYNDSSIWKLNAIKYRGNENFIYFAITDDK